MERIGISSHELPGSSIPFRRKGRLGIRGVEKTRGIHGSLTQGGASKLFEQFVELKESEGLYASFQNPQAGRHIWR